MAKKSKKRQHSRTVDLKRQLEQEKLADEKERAKKRIDPVARTLLYGDLVFLAIIAILDANGMVSDFAGGLSTLIGVVVLLIALWLQFRPKNKGGSLSKGPRL